MKLKKKKKPRSWDTTDERQCNRWPHCWPEQIDKQTELASIIEHPAKKQEAEQDRDKTDSHCNTDYNPRGIPVAAALS